MGARASKPWNGLVVTLDAQGTLYKFKEPIAAQYIKVARDCGVKAPIDEQELMKAFKAAFKEISAEYPNYGKGQLESPRVWWKSLTNDTFRRVIDEKEIPERLAPDLYARFESSAAYELYPDVLPFFQSMRQLKHESPRPGVYVGVISNGDPRVKTILQSLGLNVGYTKIPQVEAFVDRARRITSEMQDVAKAPWHNAYNPQNDIDMLVTSYDVNAEKPHPTPFLEAESLAKMNYGSKLEQEREDWTPNASVVKHKIYVARALSRFMSPTCIHVGDDYEKDYQGAIGAEFQAMHLVRDGEGEPGPEGTNTVTDLEQAAMAIRIMAAENIGKSEQNS